MKSHSQDSATTYIEQIESPEANHVLSQTMIKEMLSPVGIGNFAVGFGIAKEGQGWYFNHGGGNWGFGCLLSAHKVKGYGFAIMTNAENGGIVLDELKARIERAYNSAFIGRMSHELRTPLNAILGFTQMLTEDRTLSAVHQENLKVINSSGEHLLRLINDVLEMSRIEAGQTRLNPVSFDLHRLLDGLEGMFRLRAEEKNLQLVCHRDPSLPQQVRTDEAKLLKVLINLLDNAIKFTEKGGVTLRATCESYRLFFEITDLVHNFQFGKILKLTQAVEGTP